MNNLWAPWRMDYILSDKEEGCVFCKMIGEEDDEGNLIILRGKYHFIVMNAYPYNNGHLMVVPFRHTASLSNWETEEVSEFWEMADLCIELLKETMKPEGFNLGINLGEAGGAGVLGHIHLQIVPRWSGDTNFMTVFAETRVIPEHIQATYAKLKATLDNFKI